MTTPTPPRQLLNESVADAEPRHDLGAIALTRARTHRRRQFTVTGSALAVGAVVLGIVVANQPFRVDSAPRPNDVADQTPPPDAAPIPDVDGDGKVALTLDAARGDNPHISWIDGTTLHLASGETVELPKAYDDVVAYQGGYLAADASDFTVDEVQGGEVVATISGGGLLASPSGVFVSWFEVRGDGVGELKIRFAAEQERGYSESTVEIPAGVRATSVAFRDQGVLYETEDQTSGNRGVWFADGGEVYEIEGATAIGGYSVNADQAVVQTTDTDTGSCWSTYAFPGGEFAGALTEQTCKFSLGEFSADGEFLMGWPAYADGWGPGEATILDAQTFKPVMRFTPDEGYGVWDAVWDGDDDSLIATVYLDGTWQLLRLGVDGSIATVSEPVQADDVSNPFRTAPGA